MGDFRKKLSWTLISRGKICCKEIPGEKYPAMKKIFLMTYNAAKNLAPSSVSRGLRKKNSYAKTLITQNPPSPLTKGKWSTPKEIKDCYFKKGTSLSSIAVINEGQGRHWNPL